MDDGTSTSVTFVLGRSGLIYWFLALAWPNPICCWYLGSEHAGERDLFLSYWLSNRYRSKFNENTASDYNYNDEQIEMKFS